MDNAHSIEMSYAQKSKLVYSAYRDMLRNYNERANEILDSKPIAALSEDKGVSGRIDSIIMHQQQQAGGAPPPPPPPPPPLGQVSPMRIKTEIPAMRAEPPACVQNAMMTKDKKPFTYTPGGLDLSQIRSPRMARRLTRNANSEGVETAHAPPQHQPSTSVQQITAPPAPPINTAPVVHRPHVIIPPTVPVSPPTPSATLTGAAKSTQVGNLYIPPLDSPVTLNRAPTPWLTKNSQLPSEQSPPWVQTRDQLPQQTLISKSATSTPPSTTRVIPIEIQMNPQHYQPAVQNQMYVPPQAPQPQSSQHGPVTRIIPIQLETDSGDGAPVQSPAFRMLQKMTLGDQADGSVRHVQMNEADRALMDKLRAQVDEENFLHNEVDPRYRGAAIPSRAFRILQHMTDTDGSLEADRQEAVRQTHARIPTREQQVPQEPRRYTGSAIPSRSFQMLQAMVEPNSCAQAGETDTESSESYQPEAWYYSPTGYWLPDPYWGYYTQPYYDYGYYHPYYYSYAYDPYTSCESELEILRPEQSTVEPEDESLSEPIGLQAVTSVADIHTVYTSEDNDLPKVESEAEDESPSLTQHSLPDSSSSSTEDEEETDEEQDAPNATSEEHVPHQLSIIFEESETALSDVDRKRETSVPSEDDSSTTIAVESGDEEETVTVRLPLRFKFTRTENDEDVTTVIVGDSQVDKCNNVSVTVSIPSSSSICALAHHFKDSELKNSEDSVPDATATVHLPSLSHVSKSEREEEAPVSVRDRILAIEMTGCKDLEQEETIRVGKADEAVNNVEMVTKNDEEEIEIEDLIEGVVEEEEEEEEADSGVTSQTDTESECFQEMRRLNKYQRAATHSRLFWLLHELEAEDDEGIKETEREVLCCSEGENQRLQAVRQQLSLPLVACSRSSVPDSFSSSGIASPASTPPRRPRSELSTPADPWPDYASYYSSWEERLVLHPPARASPFPMQPPRCPMTPGSTARTNIAGGVS